MHYPRMSVQLEPLDKLAVCSLGSDESQISISGQAVSRLGAANHMKPSCRQGSGFQLPLTTASACPSSDLPVVVAGTGLVHQLA